MDWTSLLAAAAGAVIGLSGDLVGRLGARRQAREARQLAIEDAERLRLATHEDDRQREIRARARRAAEQIIAAFRDNSVLLGEPITPDLHKRLERIADILNSEYLFLPELELRRRILEMEHWIDAAWGAEYFGGLMVNQLAFAAKNEANRILGMWLRGENLDYTPIPLWSDVQAEASRAMDEYRKQGRMRQEIPDLPFTY
jgi:enoyl-CoA hydratase/carnithine racemase